MAFGWPTRYIQLDPAKIGRIPAGMSAVEAWDAAVDEANREYCKRMHNICCDNCHSHVCRALETMQYNGARPSPPPSLRQQTPSLWRADAELLRRQAWGTTTW